jgi:hypothetical protein
MRKFCVLILIVFSLIVLGSCSSGNQNPVTSNDSAYNYDQVNYPATANDLQDGKNFLGAYIMTFDPETWETEVVPDRTTDVFHANITGYLFSPPCPAKGCFQFTITSWVGDVLTLDMALANPTSLAPYDVRQIFTNLNGKKVLNPDGYSDIYDPPSTPEKINPFIAWAKTKPSRRFPAGPWSIVHEQLILEFPHGASAATGYLFECTLGGNTQEPYLIENQRQYGVLPDAGGTTVVLTDIYDWQNDINKATLDTISINGRVSNFSLISDSNTYRAYVNNYLHRPVGTYPSLIKAESPNTLNVSMYNYVDIEISDAPFSDNQLVSDCINCDASTEGIGQKALAISSSDVFIAYSDNRMGPGIYHTRIQKSDNLGDSFDPSVKISSSASAMDTLASVAVYSNGDVENVYVTWTWFDGFTYDIKFARSLDGGQTFGAEIRPYPDTYHSRQANSSICVDGNGNVYIVYEEDAFGSGINIAMIVSEDQGQTWSEPAKVNNDTTDKGHYSPAVSADLYGNACIVWEDRRNISSPFLHGDIYFTTTSNFGETFTDNIKINDTNGTGIVDPAPAISLYITGGVYVAWAMENLNDSNIYFDYSPDRVNFGTDVRVNNDLGNPADQYDPSININFTGLVCIAWTDERNGNQDIFYAESNDPSAFGENFIVNMDSGASKQFGSSIASDFLGRIYLAWSDARYTESDSNQDVFFAFRR